MDDKYSLLPCKDILTSWYLEYMDKNPKPLKYKTWYSRIGKEQLLSYLMTSRDEMILSAATEAFGLYRKVMGKGTTP